MEAVYASSSVVSCMAPAQTEPGAVEVAVSIDGGATFGGDRASDLGSAASAHFRYLAPSFVTGLSPRSGPDTGGTVVTVFGAGFNSAFRFVCKFQSEEMATEAEDNPAATAVETPGALISASELACIAPAVTFNYELGLGVEVAVFVELEGGILTRLPTSTASSSDSPTSFTYVPSLQLKALDPDRGPSAGGTVVDITGANFFPPLATDGDGDGELDTTAANETVWCRFGSTVTIGSPLSDGLVRCSSPPRSVGDPAEVEVSVSVNSGADFQGGASRSLLVRDSKLTPKPLRKAPVWRVLLWTASECLQRLARKDLRISGRSRAIRRSTSIACQNVVDGRLGRTVTLGPCHHHVPYIAAKNVKMFYFSS